MCAAKVKTVLTIIKRNKHEGLNMKNFCFTVDDNIRFFKEIGEMACDSIFEHPYLAMYKRLHEKYALKVQLNLFYEWNDYNLSMFSDRYIEEWKDNSDWLKLSFHSRLENVNPYEFSDYDEVYTDCKAVNDEILRFASDAALAKTTTLHYCLATPEGLRALHDNRVVGLLGLYGKHNPPVSYCRSDSEAKEIIKGKTVKSEGISYAGLDIVLNCYNEDTILSQLKSLYGREFIKVMIHEQYFYKDYPSYQSDFEEKIDAAFAALSENGYTSVFFEETL